MNVSVIAKVRQSRPFARRGHVMRQASRDVQTSRKTLEKVERSSISWPPLPLGWSSWPWRAEMLRCVALDHFPSPDSPLPLPFQSTARALAKHRTSAIGFAPTPLGMLFHVSTPYWTELIPIPDEIQNSNVRHKYCTLRCLHGEKMVLLLRVAVISAKNHKRQRRKRQSVTAKREKSQTPKVLNAILTLTNLT